MYSSVNACSCCLLFVLLHFGFNPTHILRLLSVVKISVYRLVPPDSLPDLITRNHSFSRVIGLFNRSASVITKYGA